MRTLTSSIVLTCFVFTFLLSVSSLFSSSSHSFLFDLLAFRPLSFLSGSSAVLGLPPLWTALTSHLAEQYLIKGALVQTLLGWLLYPLEKTWGASELLRFLVFTAVFSSILQLTVSTVGYLLYFSSSVFRPSSGQAALLLASAVAEKQVFPLRPLAPLFREIIPPRIFQARHLPFLLLCVFLVVGLIFDMNDLVLAIGGFLGGWLYLRRKDRSPEFSFDTLFPRAIRGPLKKLSDALDSLGGLATQSVQNESSEVSSENRAAFESRRKKALELINKLPV